MTDSFPVSSRCLIRSCVLGVLFTLLGWEDLLYQTVLLSSFVKWVFLQFSISRVLLWIL